MIALAVLAAAIAMAAFVVAGKLLE